MPNLTATIEISEKQLAMLTELAELHEVSLQKVFEAAARVGVEHPADIVEQLNGPAPVYRAQPDQIDDLNPF